MAERNQRRDAMTQIEMEDLEIEQLLDDLELKMVKLWNTAIFYIILRSTRRYADLNQRVAS